MLDTAGELLKIRRKGQLEDRMLLGEKWKEAPGLDNMVFTLRDGSLMWDTAIRVDIKKIIATIEERMKKIANLF